MLELSYRVNVATAEQLHNYLDNAPAGLTLKLHHVDWSEEAARQLAQYRHRLYSVQLSDLRWWTTLVDQAFAASFDPASSTLKHFTLANNGSEHSVANTVSQLMRVAGLDLRLELPLTPALMEALRHSAAHARLCSLEVHVDSEKSETELLKLVSETMINVTSLESVTLVVEGSDFHASATAARLSALRLRATAPLACHVFRKSWSADGWKRVHIASKQL